MEGGGGGRCVSGEGGAKDRVSEGEEEESGVMCERWRGWRRGDVRGRS